MSNKSLEGANGQKLSITRSMGGRRHHNGPHIITFGQKLPRLANNIHSYVKENPRRLRVTGAQTNLILDICGCTGGCHVCFEARVHTAKLFGTFSGMARGSRCEQGQYKHFLEIFAPVPQPLRSNMPFDIAQFWTRPPHAVMPQSLVSLPSPDEQTSTKTQTDGSRPTPNHIHVFSKKKTFKS